MSIPSRFEQERKFLTAGDRYRSQKGYGEEDGTENFLHDSLPRKT